MKQVKIAGTELSVSQLVFGCWGITSDAHWGQRDEADAIAAMHAALDSGVNFFDTAAMYAEGASEKLLGRAVQGRRDEVVIASKCLPGLMRAQQIIDTCEASLQRLGTDRIDLYQTHWFADRDVPVEESWAAMVKLQEQGKVRHIGVCNAGVDDLKTVGAISPPVVNQLPYNLIWRAIEYAVLPACHQSNIATLIYSPLMHGYLAGKYKTAAEVPDGRARSRHFTTERSLARHGESGQEAKTFEALAAIQKIADDAGMHMADLSLRWLISQSGVTCVIAGASNANQLQRNVNAFAQPLDAATVEALNAATADLKDALGANPDMWQGTAGSRFH